MLIGYVSDENYVAICDCLILIEGGDDPVEARSAANGAIFADIPSGEYSVVFNKDGYTGKRVSVNVDGTNPVQFRLMSDDLVGFMWPKWTTTDGSSEYCVHSVDGFKLDLWRYGWEQQFVRSYGWCDEHGPTAMAQVLPDLDFTQTGVRWNEVGYTLEFQKHGLAAPEEPGLYFLHAKTRAGRFFSFPWIISPAQPRSKMALVASTSTWNAYNKFGGRSNYFNQDALPSAPVVNSRQELARYTNPDSWPFEEHGAPLSFQRPEQSSCVPEGAKITDTIAGRTESAFAPGLWRLVGWMEREGFQFDLYPDVALHFGQLDVSQYEVLVLDNHTEYCSHETYHRLKKWVYEEGGKIAYLGGCAMLAEIEYPDEATALCRREEDFSQRGESQAVLLGTEYTHSGFQTGAPYEVLQSDHWIFESTGLNNGDQFGHASLHERVPGGASAHELDKISENSPANIQHLAKGSNPDGQGADMTWFETESGGGVFAASSLCWTLALPIDAMVSQITHNVLKRLST